jgi:thioredoxin 1
MSWTAYLTLFLVASMVGFVLWTLLATRRVRGTPVDALDSVLPDLQLHKAKAVVYCFSEHCGPCRKMTPEIDRMRERYANLFKLDVIRYAREARSIGVQATPTTLLVEDGTVLKAILGAGAIRAIGVFLEQD